MTKREDGGPAFPHMAADGHPDYRLGMTLRDYFAGQALPAVIKRHEESIAAAEEDDESEYSDERCATRGMADFVAREAYNLADAMLAERAK